MEQKVSVVDVVFIPGSGRMMSKISDDIRESGLNVYKKARDKYFVSQPAELLLVFILEGKQRNSSIAEQFRKKFEKPNCGYANLTSKRIEKIRAAKPASVNVTLSADGETYVVCQADIDLWFKRIKAGK